MIQCIIDGRLHIFLRHDIRNIPTREQSVFSGRDIYPFIPQIVVHFGHVNRVTFRECHFVLVAWYKLVQRNVCLR